jgi:hypothetical protein
MKTNDIAGSLESRMWQASGGIHVLHQLGMHFDPREKRLNMRHSALAYRLYHEEWDLTMAKSFRDQANLQLRKAA